MLFLYEVFVVCISPLNSCSQFGLATFHRPGSHVGLVATQVHSAGLEQGSCSADSGLEQLESGLIPRNVECLLIFSLKTSLESCLYRPVLWFK